MPYKIQPPKELNIVTSHIKVIYILNKCSLQHSHSLEMDFHRYWTYLTMDDHWKKFSRIKQLCTITKTPSPMNVELEGHKAVGATLCILGSFVPSKGDKIFWHTSSKNAVSNCRPSIEMSVLQIDYLEIVTIISLNNTLVSLNVIKCLLR